MSGAPESGTGVTRAEVCAVACAEVFRGDGEVMASAFGTAPAIGARLARLTFAPDLVLTDGDAALVAGAPPLAGADGIVLESHMPYRRVFDVVWSGRRNLIMMASQIDRTGNQNISAIGEWSRPQGAAGRRPRRPRQHRQPLHQLLGPEPLDEIVRRARRRRLGCRLRPRRRRPARRRAASTRSAGWCRTSGSSTSTLRATRCGSARSIRG